MMNAKKRRKIGLPLGLLLLFFSVSFLYAGDLYFKIGTTETLDAEGIKFKGMRDCPASPLPMPEANVFSDQRSGEKFELYDSFDLWRREQLVGVWKGNIGTIIIGRISVPPPAIERSHQGLVLKSDYEEWRKNAGVVDLNDEDALKAWLGSFFAVSDLSDGARLPSKSSPANCLVTAFTGSPPSGDNKKAFIYLLEPKNRPDAKFAVCYAYDDGPGSDIPKSERAIASSLASFSFFRVKKAPSALPSPRSSAKKIERSPEYLASRDEVIKNIKNAKDWEYTETDNFILVYNVKNKKTIRQMSENLERCRKVFEAFYPLKAELKAVSVCRFFEKREDYLRYVGEEYDWSSGLWESSRKELVISPADWANRADNRKIMIDIAYHEGFHQYLHYAINEALSSIWFNEGNATFFEGINFKGGGKFEIEAVEERLAMMKELAKAPPQIRKFVSISHQEFILSRDIERNYTMAWGLMFFLKKGSRVLKEKNNYSEIPTRYYEALIKSGNFKMADEEAWRDVDIEKFEEDFQEFWRSSSLIKKAERFNPLATKKSKP